MRNFKVHLIIVAILALFSFAKAEKVLNVSLGADISTLDPNTNQGGVWESHLLREIHASLMEPDGKGGLKKGLAKSYTLSKDKKVYTFKLIDAKWSDGTPITAQDFEYSIKRLLNPETAGDYASLLFDIKGALEYNSGKGTADEVGVKAVDDKTLVITLKTPAGYFLGLTNHLVMNPIPKHVVEKYGKNWTDVKNIVTSGAYKVVAREPGQFVEVVKNPYYYDAKNVKIDRVKFFLTENRETNINKFRAGDLDIYYNFGATAVKQMKATHPTETRVHTLSGTVYFTMNPKKIPNINVRKALSLAVDRDKVVRIRESGEDPSYSFVPKGLGGYVPYEYEWKSMPYAQRLAEAQKLMKEAGYGPNKMLKLETLIGPTPDVKVVFIALADDWKKIYVDATPKILESKVVYRNLSDKNFEVGRAGWVADYPDAQNFLFISLSASNYNYSGYTSPEFDALLNESNKEEGKKRNETMKKAEKLYLDAYQAIPVYYAASTNLVSKRVVGFVDNTADQHPISLLDIK